MAFVEMRRFSEQVGLAREVCPRCREPYLVVEVEFPVGDARFLTCRCGTIYEDPWGRREARGR